MRSCDRFVVLSFLAGALILPCAAAGQTVIGPMAGASFAKLHGPDAGSQKTRTGFAAGGFVEYGLHPNSAIELQAFYVQKGAKAEAEGISGTFKLDYIEIPLLLKVRQVNEGSTRIAPNLFVGPVVSFKTHCSVEASAAGTTAEMSCDDLGAKFKSTDFSVAFGGGVDIGPVALQGRYDLGLTKIEDASPQADVKTSAWIVTAGFRIPVGSK